VEAIKNLKDLFCYEIQLLWSAENLLLKKIPLLVDQSKNFGLKKLFSLHNAEIRLHKKVIETICHQIEIDPRGEFNSSMKGILEEDQELLTISPNNEAKDAVLIAGAQKATHYVMSCFGSAAYYAEMLGLPIIAQRLRLILMEIKDADAKFNFIARTIVNERAVA